MALADIISKIESDAAAEAAEIIAVAEGRAAEITAAAEAEAAAYRTATLADAEEAAAREASRVVVAARLSARDAGLAARRALIDEALAATAEALATMPTDRYVEFLAQRVAAVVRGGELVRFGKDDEGVAAAVAARLSALRPGLSVTVSDEPAPFERGALIEGDRVKADLSLTALVEERRDELELVLADAVFGKEE